MQKIHAWSAPVHVHVDHKKQPKLTQKIDMMMHES